MNEESLFAGALQRPAGAERQAFLDGACAGNPELRDRLEQLLAADGHSQGILDFEPSEGFPPEPRTGEWAPPGLVTEGPIGPYKLLERIGEGGFGVVYLAEQTEPVRRKVALKILKPGMDTRYVVARFEAERQALAIMDHPNIAKVFDGGATPAGRPFFVMELVKGVPITEYCDQNHLTPRQRLELFVSVCQAVQHAHQKGIIHRDLKPSNVLVSRHDVTPVVKVIDFGIAKALGQSLTDKTLFTGIAQMIGTPLYMSPEQAGMSDLDVDTRGDIYSLGVLLYELLTGTTPFSKKRFQEAAYDEIFRIIREEEPPKPSTRLSNSKEALPTISAQRQTEPAKLTKMVRGELDWIVMKALEKDRNRRYETANGFAMDVQRYLADEAVLACPPSVGYRLRKFVRRNRVPVIAASLVGLSLLGGFAGTSWGLIEARRQRDVAKNSAAAEKQAKQDTQTRAAETEAVLRFVQGRVFAAARPQGQDGGLGRSVTLRQALDAALSTVDASFANEPLIEARLRMTLGETYFYLDEMTIAADQFIRARAIFMEHLGPHHEDTLASAAYLASSYHDLAQHPQALALRKEVLAVNRATRGPGHSDTLVSMTNLANSYFALARYEDARKLRAEALPLFRATFGPGDPRTLSCVHNLADSYYALGEYADALKLREEVLPLVKAVYRPDHPDGLRFMSGLAGGYFVVGRYADAAAVFRETLEKQRDKLGSDHRDTLMTMNNLAGCYEQLGQNDVALQLYEEGLARRKQKLPHDHPQLLLSKNNLANCLYALGRRQEALNLREETLAVSKVKHPPGHPDTLGIMSNLAISYDDLKRHADALRLREEVLAQLKIGLGPDHPETLHSQGAVAASLVKLERGAEAVPMIDDVLLRAAGRIFDPNLIPVVMDVRLRHFEQVRDADGCRDTAERWEKFNRSDGEGLYAAARYRAVAAAVIRATDRTPDAARRADAEADRAMAWLRQAVTAGAWDWTILTGDKDIDALRDRTDFKALLAGLQADR